jgi:iron-sulfur cluster assembly protein
MNKTRSLISITDGALSKVRDLIGKRSKPTVGIKVGVKSGGCSGLSYYVEYADELQSGDEVVEREEVKIIIPSRAVMYLVGTTMDYVSTEVKSGFVFTNPNEKDKCGCGESFRV